MISSDNAVLLHPYSKNIQSNFSSILEGSHTKDPLLILDELNLFVKHATCLCHIECREDVVSCHNLTIYGGCFELLQHGYGLGFHLIFEVNEANKNQILLQFFSRYKHCLKSQRFVSQGYRPQTQQVLVSGVVYPVVVLADLLDDLFVVMMIIFYIPLVLPW